LASIRDTKEELPPLSISTNINHYMIGVINIQDLKLNSKIQMKQQEIGKVTMDSTIDKTIFGLVFLSVITSSSTTYDYTRKGLSISSYPHDIPENANQIIIDKTNIIHVDFIETFPNLIYYQLSLNPMSEFPDLSNISNTLRH